MHFPIYHENLMFVSIIYAMDDATNSLLCWWEKPLVVALKHSEGIKHTVLFQEQKLTNTKSLIHALSLSL
jgi:hypothetical protein